MNSLLLHFKKLDWILISAATLLSGFGMAGIYSTSLADGDFLNFKKQIIFFAIGFFLMVFLSFFDWRTFSDSPYFVLALYIICILSLVLLFFFAPDIRGTKSWFKLGPVSLDPIEFAKIVLIILLAKYFSKRHVEMYRPRHIFLSGLYVAIPTGLVFFQPNFGSALILASIWIGILLMSGIKVRQFLILLLLFAVIFSVAWVTVIKDYQKARITNFLMPKTQDQLNIGWNQTQAKIAIGSGGLLGAGFGRGAQTQYGFLPEAHTDFIFASISEEFGLAGAGVLLILFIVLIWRVMKIAISAKSNFPRLFASGLTTIIISQVFIHIGMNIGILPIIGTPLPLVSYGGSGVVALFAAFGLLQNIKANQ
jgi:rod shape determining protein RodA